jgi:DNA-binding response OmpR family regulator
MSGKRVLIVEDTEDIAQLVQYTLEELGLETVHVNNGAKAMAYLETQRTDLIILDIGLPGMSGWQLLDNLKAHRKQEGYKVIMLTAQADAANRVIGKMQDVDAYVSKPFEIRTLVKTVQELLESGK